MAKEFTEILPELEEDVEIKLDPPWQVVVLNDPVNLMSYVVKVFQRVFGYPLEKAEKHMIEVHRDGVSVLWSGDKEQAESYVQQLQHWQLTTKLEQWDG